MTHLPPPMRTSYMDAPFIKRLRYPLVPSDFSIEEGFCKNVETSLSPRHLWMSTVGNSLTLSPTCETLYLKNQIPSRICQWSIKIQNVIYVVRPRVARLRKEVATSPALKLFLCSVFCYVSVARRLPTRHFVLLKGIMWSTNGLLTYRRDVQMPNLSKDELSPILYLAENDQRYVCTTYRDGGTGPL